MSVFLYMSNIVTEEIKSRLNIVDVVGEYVRLTKVGTNYKGLCPFHSENTPSFNVSEDKQFFHCFGCQKGGDVFTFLMEMENMEFREVLKLLAERSGVKLEPQTCQKKEDTTVLFEVLEMATKFFQKQLTDGSGKTHALPYLYDRGISDGSVSTFRLGYIPDTWNALETFLVSRGFSENHIIQAGLAIRKDDGLSYDRFRGRILFPIVDIMGRVIGFSGRILPGTKNVSDVVKAAKYINTPETPVYHKSRALHGLFQAKNAIKYEDEVILVEGNMDVIALHQAGFSHVVAVSGTALTVDHLTLLKRYTRNITLYFDADSAGQEAAKKSAQMAWRNDLNVRIISSGDAKDAAELACEDIAKLSEVMAQKKPAMEYFMECATSRYDISDPEQKRGLLEELLDLSLSITNEVIRSEWLRKFEQRYDVTPHALLSLLEERSQVLGVSSVRRLARSEPVEVEGGTRSNVLRRQLIGLMLASSEVWETALKDEDIGIEDRTYLRKEELFTILEEKAEECEYKFNSLREVLNKDLASLANTLYTEHAFCRDNTGLPQNIEMSQLLGRYQLWKTQFLQERTKEKLFLLTRQMQQAEENEDAESVLRIQKTFFELSRSRQNH